MSKKCYDNYMPLKKSVNINEIMDYVVLLGNDEGLKIEVEDLGGKKFKIYVNKTGLEYVISIVYDNNKEENFIFSNVNEICENLFKLIEKKRVLEAILY
ncbi:MAG: hypothetical protein ACPLW4_00190 [Nitrososphaeria archaeon]